MKKLLHIASFALAIILSAGSATAYQATGAVKEVTSTPYWPHWQELSLEKGDVSVSGPCVTFLAEVRQRRAFPAPMNLWQCMALASELSDISQGQHESLPIGTSIWAPYWPPEKESVSAQAVSQADFAALESEFALAKATMVSEAQLQRLLASQASVLRSERSSELQGLREELIELITLETRDPPPALLTLLTRLTTLEEAVKQGRESDATLAGKLTEVTATIEELAQLIGTDAGQATIDSLRNRIDLMERTVATLSASLDVESQLKVLTDVSAEAEAERDALRAELSKAESSFSKFVRSTNDRLNTMEKGLEGVSSRADTLAEDVANASIKAEEADAKAEQATADVSELKEEVNQKASADSVAKLGARITALEQQAPKETPKETPWYKEWWWTWLAIALNLLLLLLLAWWLFASRRSEKKEAFEVRGDLEALAESEIQDRYNCPGFTVDRLNNYAIAEEPLELVFTDLHPGAANTKVRVKRADPYLKLIGVSDTNERNVVKPDEDGRFSASSLLKALQTARETGCVLGLSKAKRT